LATGHNPINAEANPIIKFMVYSLGIIAYGTCKKQLICRTTEKSSTAGMDKKTGWGLSWKIIEYRWRGIIV
jgi:formate/nitrite transporter FocA (FNT family)